jgi:glycosyltransferase involved in cell wall biosynthesis
MLSSYPELTVIIPTLNEETGIGLVLRELNQALQAFPYEVLVVDGHSLDDTRKIARHFGAQVLVEPRRGYGRAYLTGFGAAKAPILVTLDGDFTYPALAIPRLVNILKEQHLDFISADRSPFITSTMSLPRIIGNHLLSTLVRLLFAIDLRDSQSGMWILRKAILPMILPNINNMSFSQEIKIRAHLFSKAREVPIIYRNRHGTTKLHALRDGVANIWALLQLYQQLKHWKLTPIPIKQNQQLYPQAS